MPRRRQTYTGAQGRRAYFMAKRKGLSNRLRFEIFKRDSFSCQYCGKTPPSTILHVDHITPVSKGGDNSIDNLVTACKDCNLGKSDVPLTDTPKSLKEIAAKTKEKEDQIAGYNQILMDKKQRIINQSWEIVEALEDEDQDEYNKGRLASIRYFLKILPYAEVLEAAEITNAKFYYIGSGAFKYFCAICWSKIKEPENA